MQQTSLWIHLVKAYYQAIKKPEKSQPESLSSSSTRCLPTLESATTLSAHEKKPLIHFKLFLPSYTL